MAKTFRRTNQVYQRHPINGTPDGVISNPKSKETITGCSVFNAGTTGQGESDRDKVFKAGAFLPTTDYDGRYVILKNTPPAGGTLSTDRTGFRHEDQICRIASVDGSGDFIRLENMRFEDDGNATVTIEVLACADFTAASASFPTEPHTSNDAGPVVHQVISLPNPANKTLQIAPWVIGQRISATSVRISDLFGLVGDIPTESNLEWFLKDRPGYTMRDLFYIIARFVLDAGWTFMQNRGRWLAGQTTGTQRRYMDDMIFWSDGEDSAKSMYLRMVYFHNNNSGLGWDTNNNLGFSFALFQTWDRTFTPGSGNLDRGDGAGVGAVMLQPNATTVQNHHAGWDRHDGSANHEPAWNPDQGISGRGGFVPIGNSINAYKESFFAKNEAYDTTNFGFIGHPMRFPMGGTFCESNYILFGDKDELHFWILGEGFGISTMSMGYLEPLPSQIQHSFFTTAPTSAGSNSIIRVGTQNPEALPSGPSYQVGDNIQIVGQRINPGHDWQLLSHSGEFIETAFIQAIGEVGAIGKIQCVAKAQLVDNTDTFTVNDGEGNNITFYYDVDGAGGGAGTAIDVSGDTTASQVATTTASVLNASLLNITFTPNGDVVDALHNTVNSAPTNVAMSENVNDPGFTVEGMQGSGYGITTDVLNNDYAVGALAGEDPQPLFQAMPWVINLSFNGTVQGGVRVSNRARNGDPTYFDHNGQQNCQTDGHGFNAIMQVAPLNSTAEIGPSRRTNRFGLLGFFVRDPDGDQWRGRMRYLHLCSKYVRPYRFIRDRDGNYYYTVPPIQFQDNIATTLESSTLALGPMPQALAIPS